MCTNSDIDWEMSSGAMGRSIEHLHDAHMRAQDHLQTSLNATYDFITRQNDEESSFKDTDEGGEADMQHDMPLDPDTFSSQLMTLSRDTTKRLKGIFSKVQKEYSDMEEAATFAAMGGVYVYSTSYICVYTCTHIYIHLIA